MYIHYRPLLTLSVRTLYQRSMSTSCETFFVTTPIFYVNARPHIGHLYTALLGDALARWHRMKGREVLFSSGTDEHGLKIQQAASNRNMPPQQFCDTVSKDFVNLFQKANISYDDFIRTTQSRHVAAVNDMWNKLKSKGFIYKGSYKGWYSISDEAYLTEDEVMDQTDSDGSYKISKLSGHKVEWTEETNYMFSLPRLADNLKAWLKTDPIKPEKFRSLVEKWIDVGLQDLSVSRSKDRLSWGIQVPGDETQTIYVWLDALVNYLTVAGDTHWPANVHIVGKDILKFHAIYWPAFLIAAGFEPPKTILCHSHWLKDNQKMSKSIGNVIDPFDEIEKYSSDGLRYFLLKEGVPHSDGNYSSEKVKQYINSDLVNTLGNLLSRCTSESLNPDQIFPALNSDVFEQKALSKYCNILEQLDELTSTVDQHYCNFNIYKGLDCIFNQLRLTNGFIQDHKPWTLKNDPKEKEWLNCILHVCLATLHITSKLIQPVVPNMASKISHQLAVKNNNDIHSYQGKLGPNPGPLVPRLK